MRTAAVTLALLFAIATAHYDPLSVTGDWLIQAYKRVISPLQGKEICNFNPTCSQFTRAAIRNCGFAPGVLMGADRLMRCHGFAWSYLGEHYHGIVNNRLVDPPDRHIAWQTPPLLDVPPSQLPRRHPVLKTLSLCDSSLLVANRLYEAGAFNEAALEFLRVRFTSQSPTVQTCAALMAGEAYLAGAEPASARRAFATANLPSAGGFTAYGIARALFAQGRYADTRHTLDSAKATQGDLLSRSGIGRQSDLLYAWSLFREGRFRDATRYAASTGDDSISSSLARFDGSGIRRRSRLAATLFSAILPGAGQIYSGRTGDGVYAFITVAALGFVTSHFVLHQSKDPDHIKLGIFGSLTAIFYAGNVYGANIAARDFNQVQERELISRIDTLLADIDLLPDYSALLEFTVPHPPPSPQH